MITDDRLLLVLACMSISGYVSAQTSSADLCGVVEDENGSAVDDALVVASGAGFQGWSATKADGSFCLKAAGAFVSVRRAGFAPILKPTAEVRTHREQVMTRAHDNTVRKLTACRDLPEHARGWTGSGLRVKAPRGTYDGPVNGEHDRHWYIRSGKAILHIVDGYAWH